MRSSRLLLPLLFALAAFGLAGPSQAGARPTAEPQVVCISSSSPVESPAGFYSRRPGACDFLANGRPAADAYMVQMRRIHWLHWGAQSAVGRGVSLVNMVGPVFAKVRLTRPRTVCGHRVFTVARFKGHRGGYGTPMQLTRRLSSC